MRMIPLNWRECARRVGGLAAFGLLLTSNAVLAAGGGGGGMPWDGPLTRVVQSLTGNFAYSLVILGFLVLGIMLVMVHDWSRFAQGIVCVIVAGSLMVGAATAASAIGITGAIV